MKIITLIENTAHDPQIKAEHGLSFYIETTKHKILFDAGQTDAFADNAQRLGIDLSQVDLVILSHGHYDHSGGLMRFLELNKRAPIYLNKNAFAAYYNGTEKYIGINSELKKSDRLIFTDDFCKIDEELTLYSCNDQELFYPINSFGLNVLEKGVFSSDRFLHEQYLAISENEKTVLFSGCSHKGILNIVNWFEPDVLVGGFHFMKLDPQKSEDAETLIAAADVLLNKKTIYYTGHCTGEIPYQFLKERMKERLHYMAAGKTIWVS